MSSKKNKKSYWNYRVLTRLIPFKEGEEEKWREFFIAEVHYKDGKPSGYGAEKTLTSGWETVKDLKWTVKHLKEAFEKPIIDANNFPKKWKE